MRKVALALLLAMAVEAVGLETDKVAHAGITYGTTTLGYGLLKVFGIESKADRLFWSLLASTAISVGKEMADKQMESGDLAADAAGIVLATGAVLVFDF